jgi:hypothetical protein
VGVWCIRRVLRKGFWRGWRGIFKGLRGYGGELDSASDCGDAEVVIATTVGSKAKSQPESIIATILVRGGIYASLSSTI